MSLTSVLLFLVIYLLFSIIFLLTFSCIVSVGCHGCDHMVVVLITTYAISAYHVCLLYHQNIFCIPLLSPKMHEKVEIGYGV
jgi:hypothetical protein